MKTIVLIITCFVTYMSQAQYALSGSVTDAASGVGLPFASVTLSDTLRQVVASAAADEKGVFELRMPSAFTKGKIAASYIGYAAFETDIRNSGRAETIGIPLRPAPTSLQDVTVQNRRQAVSFKGDKMVLDIEKAGIGEGNNGLETLRLVPGMRLDKDDNLLFRGNGDLQIMINGKKSLLQGNALREYLRSLKGTDIEKVEVIAQPSARYEASGTAGILNVVLKRNKGQGLGGSVYSWVSQGEFFKHQQGGRAFYNDSLWTVSGNASYYDGKSFNRRRVKQDIVVEGDRRHIDQRNEWLPVTVSRSANLAVERRLSKRQLVSTEWQFSDSDADEKTNGTTREYRDGVPNTVLLTQRMQPSDRRLTGNVFYNFTADSAATKLDLQANYARYTTDLSGYQRNDYPDSGSMQLEGIRATRYGIAAFQADLTRRLSKRMDMEAGARYSDVDMRYHNRYATDNGGLLLLPDSLLVNAFSYREKALSAYGQLALNLQNWGFLAGIRLETYRYVAASEVNHEQNTARFTNVFPSLSINHKRGEHQYQFSYSRRIGRPGYLALNPYYQYIDAYTVDRGNPELRPQLYHSFQLGYSYKGALNVSLYGYLYEDGFTGVIDYREDDGYNMTYQANAASGQRFGLSASMPYEKGMWSMQLSLDLAYSGERSDIEGFAYDGHGFGYDANLYQALKFKNDWTIIANGFYGGRGTTPNGYTRPSYDASLSVKKSLWDKKVQLVAGCSNFLMKSRYSQVTEVGNVRTDWTNRWETRRFYLQATYSFGGTTSRKVRSAGLDNEASRM